MSAAIVAQTGIGTITITTVRMIMTVVMDKAVMVAARAPLMEADRA